MLISAKSVELTESSSEEDDNEAEQLVQKRKKQPTKQAKESVAPAAPKFTGLKLEHSLPSSNPPVKANPSKEEVTAANESSARTKEKKKSKTKKKKEKEEVDDKADVKQTTTPVAVAAATVDTNTPAIDPFSSSLLDAWLDSPTGDPLVRFTAVTIVTAI